MYNRMEIKEMLQRFSKAAKTLEEQKLIESFIQIKEFIEKRMNKDGEFFGDCKLYLIKTLLDEVDRRNLRIDQLPIVEPWSSEAYNEGKKYLQAVNRAIRTFDNEAKRIMLYKFFSVCEKAPLKVQLFLYRIYREQVECNIFDIGLDQINTEGGDDATEIKF